MLGSSRVAASRKGRRPGSAHGRAPEGHPSQGVRPLPGLFSSPEVLSSHRDMPSWPSVPALWPSMDPSPSPAQVSLFPGQRRRRSQPSATPTTGCTTSDLRLQGTGRILGPGRTSCLKSGRSRHDGAGTNTSTDQESAMPTEDDDAEIDRLSSGVNLSQTRIS